LAELIIAGGTVVSENAAGVLDVAIEGERIIEVAPAMAETGARRIDARGLLVLPGLIDPHVHLSLPMKRTVSSDDIESGTVAALFGGVTTIGDFTLPRAGQTLAEGLSERMAQFRSASRTDYWLHVMVTDFGDLGRQLDEAVALAPAASRSSPAIPVRGPPCPGTSFPRSWSRRASGICWSWCTRRTTTR